MRGEHREWGAGDVTHTNGFITTEHPFREGCGETNEKNFLIKGNHEVCV